MSSSIPIPRGGRMTISVKQVTNCKRLRGFIKMVLSIVNCAQLVGGKKHRALLIGRGKLPIPSTPSGDERRLVLNFRAQLKRLMIVEGLSIVGI